MGQRGKQGIIEEFSAANMGANYDQIYQGVPNNQSTKEVIPFEAR